MRVPAPLRRPEFRSLWLAGLLSDTGDWLLFIALPIVVYSLTGSALGTSLAFLVELVPGILLAPLAGWGADRWHRRRVLVVVSLLQATALVPLLAVHTRADLPIVYAVILVEAALFTLFDPAKNALLPTLVPAADLVSANSLIGLNQNLGRLVGGPLGGVLLAAGGLRLVTVADLISYLLAAALISPLNPSPDFGSVAQTTDQQVPTRGSYKSALRGRRVRAALLVAFSSQIAQGIFVVLFILYVAQRLHGGSAEIGLLRGVQAIGAIAGGLALTWLSRAWSPVTLTAWAATAFGLVEAVLWNAPLLSTATAIYIALFIVIGAPGIVLATGLISTLQIETADDERGRVFSGYNLACNLGQAIGMLAAGVLTAPLGLMTLLNTQALLYLATGGLAAWCMTRHQRRPRTAHQTPSGAGQ